MAERKSINCDVWQITFPEWERVSPEIREKFWEVLRDWSSFEGPPKGRQGFAGIRRNENIIMGFYLQEDLRTGLEGENPAELRQSQDANFEKLFFAIVLDVGHIIIQRTNLSDYVSMNYTSMRSSFEILLTQVFARAGLPISRMQMSKFYKKRAQDEMRQLFFDNFTVEVEVTDLKGKVVPESITLSNPDPTEEIFLKRIFNREFERIESETIRAVPGEDLRKTKTAKAAVGAGHVNRLKIHDSNNREEIIVEEQDEKIGLPINDNKQIITDEESKAIIEVYERRIRITASAPQISDLKGTLGPLFSQLDSSNA